MKVQLEIITLRVRILHVWKTAPVQLSARMSQQLFSGLLRGLSFILRTLQYSLKLDRSSFTSAVMENHTLIQQRRNKCPKTCILTKVDVTMQHG